MFNDLSTSTGEGSTLPLPVYVTHRLKPSWGLTFVSLVL